jgi:hypothetical protein
MTKAYSSTINDAKYDRYETEHDQIKSELELNPGMVLYKGNEKDGGEIFRMILNEDIKEPYVTAKAFHYWGFVPKNFWTYSLENRELVIHETQL